MIVINSYEIIDANGKNTQECIENFKKGNQAKFTTSETEPVAGLIKFDAPITNEEIDSELSNIGFKEFFLPRQVKLAVLAASRATQGLNLPKNTTVIGTTLEGSVESKVETWRSFYEKKPRIGPKLSASVTASTICTTISRTLNFNGASFMITQACTGFLTALDIGSKFLETGQSEAVIILGIEASSNPNLYLFKSMGVYTSSSVMPFDANRSGMAIGEGVSCFVITKEQHARQQVAKIKKISLYNDFFNLTSASPDGSAGIFLLKNLGAFEESPDSINCHVTSTRVGDDIELKSLEELPYSTDIYGLKGSIGHTLAASAGIEMSYGISGMKEGWIPYTSTTSDPLKTKHNIVLHNIKEKANNNFIKLSFGFGGVSAGIWIEK